VSAESGKSVQQEEDQAEQEERHHHWKRSQIAMHVFHQLIGLLGISFDIPYCVSGLPEVYQWWHVVTFNCST
jgi:hypothetical protein